MKIIRAEVQPVDRSNKDLAHKSCALLTDNMSGTINTPVHSIENLYFLILVHILLEYGGNFANTLRSLIQCFSDKLTDDIGNSSLFQFKW